MQLLERSLKALVQERLGEFPAVIIEGPRQSGKTTLVRQFAGKVGNYHSFEDESLISGVRLHGDARLAELGERMIIDEIQLWPRCLRAVKHLIDASPNEPGRFLLTGSSSIATQARDADSLAGRACFLTLLPLSQAEILGRPAGLLVDYLFSDRTDRPDFSQPDVQLGSVIHIGGYPRLLACRTRRQRYAWLRNYIRALQMHDIPALASLRSGGRIADVLGLLAASATGNLNIQKSAESLQMSQATLNKVISVLEDLKIIAQLSRYIPGENIFMRKRPQVQFTDSGLLATILKIAEPEPGRLLASGKITGALFETFVFSEIVKHCNSADIGHEIGFWRDPGTGREVDLAIGLEGRMVGIEVKSASIARKDFLDGLKSLADRAAAMQRAVVIYSGDSFLHTEYKSRHGRVPMQFIPAGWLWADIQPALFQQ